MQIVRMLNALAGFKYHRLAYTSLHPLRTGCSASSPTNYTAASLLFDLFRWPNVSLVSTPLTIEVTLCGITQLQRDSNCCWKREALSASLQQRHSLTKSSPFLKGFLVHIIRLCANR